MLRQLGFLLRSMHLNRVARMAPEEVERIQLRRLQRLVAHAVAYSSFWREKYRGVDIDRLELTDLPPVNKRELMENFDETLTDPAIRRADLERFIDDEENRTRYFRDRYVVSHTSGSQGQPLLLVQDRFVYDLLFALQMSRGNGTTPVSLPEALRRLQTPVRLATVGSAPGFYPSSVAFAHYPKAMRSWTSLQCFAATDPDLVDKLNEYQPHILIGYASLLDILAVRYTDLSLAGSLRQIVNNSETLTLQARQRLTDKFGVPVLDNYASGECILLTNGCRHGPGCHVNADCAILEVVDDDYRPVSAGTVGRKVLMTNLANPVQPIIRYEVGDMLALGDEPCPCGSRLPKVIEIHGRTGESLWVQRKGAHLPLSGGMFKNVLDYHSEVREWQAVQEARNQINLRLELLPGTTVEEPAFRQRLLARFRSFGVPDDVTLAVTFVRAIEPDPETHKVRRIIDRIGPPTESRPRTAAREKAQS